MKKVLCTLAVGDYNRCLDIARPTFQGYCYKHGYAYVEGQFDYKSLEYRPPSWGKILLMHELLDNFDLVLWVDCDALIINNDVDVVDYIAEDKIQAVAFHQYEGEDVPTAGTWAVKKEMQSYLVKIWSMTKYTEHTWWEQAGLQELMGYEQDEEYLTPRPLKVKDTELSAVTQRLPLEWAMYTYKDMDTVGNILHFPAGDVPHRTEWMEKWIQNLMLKKNLMTMNL